MTARYTNEEWTAFITDTESKVKALTTADLASNAHASIPAIGSPAFYKTIDHTLLKLDSKARQFDTLCSEARINGFATVCVRPQWVKQCVSNLKGTDIKVASVVGFHEGTYSLSHKAEETRQSLDSGAGELDIVLNYPQLQAGHDYQSIFAELAALRSQAPHPTLLKLIFETSQLNTRQIVAACVLAAAANFDFVKTATGFNGHGATEEHVRLMAACCAVLAPSNVDGPGGRTVHMQIKASGGVRTLGDAVKMLQSGATRLGTSAGVWIAKEAKEYVEQKGQGTGNGDDVSRPGMATRLFTDY